MATEPEKIDAAFYAKLKSMFSLAEIVEIGVFIAFNLGFHTFFGTLDFYPMFNKEGKLVSQEESRRVYGDAPASHTASHTASTQAISAS